MGEILNQHTEDQEPSCCPRCLRSLGDAALKNSVDSKRTRPEMPSVVASQVRSSVTSGGPRAVVTPSSRKIIVIETQSPSRRKG